MSRQPSTSGIERQSADSATFQSRRRFLAVTVAAGSTALAGCANAVDYLAGFVLDDINLFNATDRTLSGEITVTGPDGSTALSESFEVEPDDDEDGDVDNEDGDVDDEDDVESDSGAVFEDVIGDAGAYRVAVDLAADSAIDGETEGEHSVSVTDPEEEHIVVVLGAAEIGGPVDAFVIEEFTDIQERLNGD